MLTRSSSGDAPATARPAPGAAESLPGALRGCRTRFFRKRRRIELESSRSLSAWPTTRACATLCSDLFSGPAGVILRMTASWSRVRSKYHAEFERLKVVRAHRGYHNRPNDAHKQPDMPAVPSAACGGPRSRLSTSAVHALKANGAGVRSGSICGPRFDYTSIRWPSTTHLNGDSGIDRRRTGAAPSTSGCTTTCLRMPQ